MKDFSFFTSFHARAHVRTQKGRSEVRTRTKKNDEPHGLSFLTNKFL